jgi:hypothetical protein
LDALAARVRAVMPDSDQSFILRVAVLTLSLIVVIVVFALLRDFVVSSSNDEKIIAALSPPLNTIVGCFVGLLSGLLINRPPKPPA